MIRHGNVYMTLTDIEQKLPIFLTCVGGWRNQYPIRREEGWPDYQWIQCIHGRGSLKIYDKEYTVEEGQGILLFPDESHEYFALTEPWEVRWLSFNGEKVREILSLLGLDCSKVIALSDPDPLLKKMHGLMSAAAANAPMNGLECSAIVYQIILEIYRFGTLNDVRSRHQHFSQLMPAIRFIEDHFQRPITLQDIAQQLEVSHQHTCLLFKQTLGMRPFEYITKVRLRKAKELLLHTPSLDIAEIAQLVGYENQSYFIKMFKRNEGVTPRKFRKHL